MSGFIEVTERWRTTTFLDDKDNFDISKYKTSVNIKHISRYSQREHGCYIIVVENYHTEPHLMNVVETYDEIKQLIQQATAIK
ncbi:MAG: hypothetical protein [Circular genetic element sp.]|nr:MAG: hypothetical protein [Circular genetic element sp.]